MGKTYDPALRKTEHGSKLYEIWKRIRKSPHSKEWDYFPAFYEWAMQNGHENGAWLRLIDKSGTYHPGNCVWYLPGVCENSSRPASWEDSWNTAVNRIRKHYGMPPLEGTDYGDL